MLDNTLHFRRVSQLLICDLRNTWLRNVLLLGGLFLLSMIAFYILVGDSSLTRQNTEWLMDHWIAYSKFHISYFPAVLLTGGFIFTSLIFGEMTNRPSRQFFLMLPATHLEKWLSKWLLSAIIFPLALILLYQFFALYTYSWFRGVGFEMVRLPLTDPWIWQWYLMYILIQSVFFLGAIWMPRFSLLKSLMLLAALGGAGFLLFEFSLYTLMSWWSEDLNEFATTAASGDFALQIDPAFFNYLETQSPLHFKMLFGLFLTPLTLLTSFLKLQEKQA